MNGFKRAVSLFRTQLNLVVLVMTLHKMHSTAALKPDSSRHDNLRCVQCLITPIRRGKRCVAPVVFQQFGSDQTTRKKQLGLNLLTAKELISTKTPQFPFAGSFAILSCFLCSIFAMFCSVSLRFYSLST